MGTNYYLRTNHCHSCNRHDERHIGKLSCGWRFSFRGYRGEIESYQDWLKVLQEGEIFNEYEEKVSLEDFRKTVETKDDNDKDHITEAIKEGAHSEYVKEHCWNDSEGYSFSDAEFF